MTLLPSSPRVIRRIVLGLRPEPCSCLLVFSFKGYRPMWCCGSQVDISSWRAKDGRVRQQIRDICSILCGLVVASDYRQGQQLISGRDFKANAAWFQNVFEVGRRYKIMNPGA